MALSFLDRSINQQTGYAARKEPCTTASTAASCLACRQPVACGQSYADALPGCYVAAVRAIAQRGHSPVRDKAKTAARAVRGLAVFPDGLSDAGSDFDVLAVTDDGVWHLGIDQDGIATTAGQPRIERSEATQPTAQYHQVGCSHYLSK